jgi:hypothetical protein
MKRSTPTLFVLLLAGGVALLVAARHGDPARVGAAGPLAGSARSGARVQERGTEPADGGSAFDFDAPAAAGSDRGPRDEANADAGGAMLDGGAVPDLEGEAPKSVVFGVVLVEYAGAQGAAPGVRSRADAETLANELARLAKDDFKAAVDKGDPGSTTNVGRMFRGVLEPAPEYVLFKLGKGEVSEPIDTPRGFWIVKRIE